MTGWRDTPPARLVLSRAWQCAFDAHLPQLQFANARQRRL